MKVLMLNGSAKKEGNTYQSLLEVGKELERQGIEYEIFQIGKLSGERLYRNVDSAMKMACVCG